MAGGEKHKIMMNSINQKYVFKPYSRNFPTLFSEEKKRIVTCVQNNLDIDCLVEHVGSTAVPGLGGKGIIDIAIALHKTSIEKFAEALIDLGYIYREVWSTPERWFFRIDLPDVDEGMRRYHVHVTFLESIEWRKLIGLRDYLRKNPDEVQRYAELKKKAALQADQDGALYRELKEPFFEEVLKKIA